MLASELLKQNSRWFALNGDAPIDLTTPAEFLFDVPSGLWAIATAMRSVSEFDGTLTSSAVANAGNDAGKINLVASSANVFGTLANVNASTSPAQAAATMNNLNPASSANTIISTSTPFSLVISVGAVLNTATFYRARVWLFCNLVEPA